MSRESCTHHPALHIFAFSPRTEGKHWLVTHGRGFICLSAARKIEVHLLGRVTGLGPCPAGCSPPAPLAPGGPQDAAPRFSASSKLSQERTRHRTPPTPASRASSFPALPPPRRGSHAPDSPSEHSSGTAAHPRRIFPPNLPIPSHPQSPHPTGMRGRDRGQTPSTPVALPRVGQRCWALTCLLFYLLLLLLPAGRSGGRRRPPLYSGGGRSLRAEPSRAEPQRPPAARGSPRAAPAPRALGGAVGNAPRFGPRDARSRKEEPVPKKGSPQGEGRASGWKRGGG